MDKIIKPVLIIGIIAAYIAMRLAAWKKTEGNGIDNDNPYISADSGKEKSSGGNLYVRFVKPFFDHVLDSLHAEPRQCILVGDDINVDIAGARNAGIDQIFCNFAGATPDFEPTHTVTSLTDIMSIL